MVMPGQKTPDTTAHFSERRTRLPASAHTDRSSVQRHVVEALSGHES
jgi:hypothetical protein